MSPNAEMIMEYVRNSILIRGGTGRRLSRIQNDLGLTDEECQTAFEEIARSGQAVFDEPLAELNVRFIYLVPT